MDSEMIGPRADRLVIPHHVLPWLQLQRGRIYDKAAQGADVWAAAYAADLREQFATFESFLPPVVDKVLDIGGGCGGIDVLISRRYDPRPQVVIVDGIADATLAFLEANGIKGAGVIPPATAVASNVGPCDLIVSLQAWCFHFPPDEYLNLAARVLTPEGRMVVDVRRGALGGWRADLAAKFREVAVVHRTDKYCRVVYAGKP